MRSIFYILELSTPFHCLMTITRGTLTCLKNMPVKTRIAASTGALTLVVKVFCGLRSYGLRVPGAKRVLAKAYYSSSILSLWRVLSRLHARFLRC